MKARTIELWPIERLIPYAKNARTHSPEQIAQIAASIQEFGFTNPILVDGDDGILAGHGRLAAAKDLALDQVPVIVLGHLSPAQRRAYVLADNKLALNAGWDEELLQQELAKLQIEDFNLDVIGFSEEEIAKLLDPEGIDAVGDPTGADDPGKEYQQKYAVAVECTDEAEQEAVYEKLNSEGYTCRLLTV